MLKLKFSIITILCFTAYRHLSGINDSKYPFHPTQQLNFTSSNLPIVMIDLDTRMADKEQDLRVSASMKIIRHKKQQRK